MNALRTELAALLRDTETERKPALRRSLREDYLYAADLPVCAAREATEGFLQRAEKNGWKYERDGGWLLLDKDADEPPEGWFAGVFGEEAAACASLLRRNSGKAPAGNEIRLLIKAGEEDEKAYEEACRRLHMNWAERLRRREALPAVNLKYLER